MSMGQLTIPGTTFRVAALYVQPDGCYAAMPDVDPWPESRDARTYAADYDGKTRCGNKAERLAARATK